MQISKTPNYILSETLLENNKNFFASCRKISLLNAIPDEFTVVVESVTMTYGGSVSTSDVVGCVVVCGVVVVDVVVVVVVVVGAVVVVVGAAVVVLGVVASVVTSYVVSTVDNSVVSTAPCVVSSSGSSDVMTSTEFDSDVIVSLSMSRSILFISFNGSESVMLSNHSEFTVVVDFDVIYSIKLLSSPTVLRYSGPKVRPTYKNKNSEFKSFTR